MPRPFLPASAFAIAFALAACGGASDAPSEADVAGGEVSAAPLPAPMQDGGEPVTGMPDSPGPGAVPLATDAAPEPPQDANAVLFADGMPLPPLPDTGEILSPVRDAVPGQSLPSAAGTLPPLEDNPEAGLGEGTIEVVRAPRSGVAEAAPTSPPAPAVAPEQQAADAVRAYYDAIASGDFRSAYALWSDGGRASGRTPEQFRSSFDGTRIVRVSIGSPGRVEGAAGSRLVQVPVTITSHTADGRELRQVGSFAMRSSQVEGAAAGWRIASADLRELQP